MKLLENSTNNKKYLKTNIRINYSIYQELVKRKIVTDRKFNRAINNGLRLLIEDSKQPGYVPEVMD